MITTGAIIRQRWRLNSKIGQGAFGDTYLAEDILSGELVAIKFERPGHSRCVLSTEAGVLRALLGCPHVCRFISHGKVQKHDYLVMQLLGQNLSQVRKQQPSGIFPIPKAALLGCQMLEALREVHQRGYLHRDVKPSNFAVSLDIASEASPQEAYLIDFGLARKHINDDGSIREARTMVGFRGTARYASPAAHTGFDLGRKDDLWSWFYILVEMMLGQLPWRQEKDRNVIGEIKQRFLLPQSLVWGLPQQMTVVMNYLLQLSYESAPDYDYLHSIVMSMAFTPSSTPQLYHIPFHVPSLSNDSLLQSFHCPQAPYLYEQKPEHPLFHSLDLLCDSALLQGALTLSHLDKSHAEMFAIQSSPESEVPAGLPLRLTRTAFLSRSFTETSSPHAVLEASSTNMMLPQTASLFDNNCSSPASGFRDDEDPVELTAPRKRRCLERHHLYNSPQP